jgi:hypothetical protein
MNSPIQVALIALGGVAVGSVLTFIANYILQRSSRSSQRKQWVLDKKAAEYGELLSTLAKSVECMAQNSIDFGMALPSLLTEEQQRLAYNNAASEARKTIEDRIFISKGIHDACVINL